MRVDDAAGRIAGVGLHASAVAIGDRALLIHGLAGSGKSRLALALIAATTARRRIVLLGDDRILLVRRGGDLLARPHPRIAGFVERRGIGFVALPWRGEAPVAGQVMLGATGSAAIAGCPLLRLGGDADRWPEVVLRWWSCGRRDTGRTNLRGDATDGVPLALIGSNALP